MTIRMAYFTGEYDWFDISSAPKETKVLVYGGGPVRFGYQDALGRWRASHHGPIRGTPTHWGPIPRPKIITPKERR